MTGGPSGVEGRCVFSQSIWRWVSGVISIIDPVRILVIGAPTRSRI